MGIIYSTVKWVLGWSSDANLDFVDPATGLTNRQKNAVRDSWKLVAMDLKGNGIAFFGR
jgi:hypothetical protein